MYPKNKIPTHEVQQFIYIFYTVGVLGFLIPYSKAFFITITPFALVLNLYLLAIYHTEYTLKTVSAFVLIFLFGFFIEVVGVKTGLIFGHYYYDRGLGLKVLETPLLIGANWLFLSYTSSSILRHLKVKKGLLLVLAPALMLMYDLVLEQVAPHMHMWHWENSSIPLQNYVAWYAIAFIMVALLQSFKVNTANSLAKPLFICQFVFFSILMIVFN